MERLVFLLIILALVSACIIGFGRFGRHAAAISIFFNTLIFGVALVLLAAKLGGAPNGVLHLNAVWGSVQFDPLAALMSAVISGISLIVHIYSRRYMVEDPGYGRFFALLDLMTACLLLMVCAADLLTMLIAWNLIGLVLFWLLDHCLPSRSAYRYGFWTFITYRFSDLPLVLAALILHRLYGSWSIAVVLAKVTANPGMTFTSGLPVAGTVAALVALSAFGRSAQFLLHTWLPYTMDGPTPVSALMHAGIVNAGAFIINRFAPVFVAAGFVLHWVFVVGLVTAITGSLLMLAQNDIKKSLGYSTMGQMGFMIMECGVGAFSLAIFHLIAHGLFKATLFLSSGSAINQARADDGVPKSELYTFVVERRATAYRQPWQLMALITLGVPAAILLIAHWLVGAGILVEQGAIVLLFFGWITGAQLLFSIHRMDTEDPWRMVSLAIVSLVVVVLGYTFISHAFDLFLYPDVAFRRAIFSAAAISPATFDGVVVLVTLVIVAGWILAYRATHQDQDSRVRTARFWLIYYALISREFYIADLYAAASRGMLNTSRQVNLWLRWV
ncbi:MAG: oxidoreductase [Rhodospirillales bacterium 20-60-12]|nr:MAG: oxidoreductase [Rhodospirillales bacterium 20-60-12]HQT66130.1 proton-conducting transporter membrane subunit [Acetobacteraceae bacterium]